jgi:hypothetical protein
MPRTRSYTSNWVTVGADSHPGNLATEFDGLTSLLRTREVTVTAGVDIDVTIVISDVQSGDFDSGVYMPAGSLQIRNCTSDLEAQSPVHVSAITGALDWTRRIVWWADVASLGRQADCGGCMQ